MSERQKESEMGRGKAARKKRLRQGGRKINVKTKIFCIRLDLH